MSKRRVRQIRKSALVEIRARAGAGFDVLRGGASWIEAEPVSGGFRVARGKAARWFLRRFPASASGGFVLCESARRDAREVARSARIPSVGDSLAGTHLVLADGRTFAIGSARATHTLMSWEGFGPYATLTPVKHGFRLEATLSGEAIVEDEALVTLLAAEWFAARSREEEEDEARCKIRVTASRRGGATAGGAGAVPAARGGRAAAKGRSSNSSSRGGRRTAR